MRHRNGKYNARKVKADGYTFDSQAEYARYCELKMLEAAGEISGLSVHPEFELVPAFRDKSGKKHRRIVYEADFEYVDVETGETITEDVKGVQVPVFRLKMKLLLFKYPAVNLRIVGV